MSRKRKISAPPTSPVRPATPWDPPTIAATSPNSPTLFHLAILILLSLSLYAPTLRNDFVTDDQLQILNNPLVLGGKNLFQAFTGDVWSFSYEGKDSAHFGSNYYRPLQLLVYAAEYGLFGGHPGPWHLVNVLLNTAVVSLIYLLLASLASPTLAFWTALWFALHPMHSEPVAWVAALPELQCALFLLLAMLSYHRVRRASSPLRFLLLSAMFFLAALFSKESALLFPVILVCYEFFYARTPLADLRSLSLRIAPFLTVLGVYLFARISALGGFAPHPQPERTPISALETLFAIPPLFARYVGKLLIPTGMNYFYAFPLTTKFNAWAAAGLLSALLLLAAIFYFRNKQPLLSFAICWFILTLAPAFSINSLGVNFFTERYLYIPSVGFSILAASLALAIYSGVQASSLRLAFRVALAALFVFYVVQTERRVAIFHDNFTLLSDTVRSSPHSYAAQGQLGFAYDERGEVDHALEHVLLALQINPAYEVGQINAAWYLTEKGNYDAAILHLKDAIRLHPDYLLPWINLAKVYSLQHDWQHARETLEHAATLNPGKSAHFLQLAAMAASNEKAGAAFADLQSAVDRAPDDFAAWVRLGDATGQAGQWSRAANAFQRAAKLQPANVLVLDKWGISLERAGDSAQAVEILQRAVQLRSDSLLIRQALAGALAADNRLADSSTQLRKILHLNPAWEHADQVHLALAVNLEKSGDRTGAMQEYQRALALNPSLDFASKRLAALAAQK